MHRSRTDFGRLALAPRNLLATLLLAVVLAATWTQLAGATRAEAAFENCGVSGEDIFVDIVQIDRANELLPIPGAVVVLTPAGSDGLDSESIRDNGGGDASSTVGRLRRTNVCNTTADSTYTVSLVSLPFGLECEVVDGDETGITVPDGTSASVVLEVSGCNRYNILIKKEATPDTADPFLFSIAGTRLGCQGTYLLHDDETLKLNCPAPAIYAVTEHQSSAWQLSGIECVARGLGSSQTEPDRLRAWIGLSAGTDAVLCVFRNTPAPPKPATISIVAPTNVGAQSVSHLNVFVRTATGAAVPDGTRVEIDTTLGYVTPEVAFTAGGSVTVAYVSPATVGSALITARADRVIGQTNIRVGPCDAAAGLRLRCVSSTCPEETGGLARVTFTWDPVPGALLQWLDLSLFDNGFAPGTFLGTGPMPPGAPSLTWSGILPGLTHYWRVNSLMPDGTWRPSETGLFRPCGDAAAPAFVSLSESDSGSTVRIRRAGVIEVSLAGNPTTGFTWEVAPGGAAGLQQIGEAAFVPSSGLLGAGGTFAFRFQAITPGVTTLRLSYHRPFEPAVAPLRTFQMTVVVVE